MRPRNVPVDARSMPIESAEFRRILGHWSTGVAIICARSPDGSPCGLTANAVCSLSLEPPLILVCVEKTADSHDCIRDAGAFAVNVLAAEHELTARKFAADDGPAKFEGVAYHDSSNGSPVLDDALAWIDCTVHAVYPGGDHTIFVGNVVAGDAVDGEPLLYYRGGYRRAGP